eukprot:TRINITY_DN26453_c0_g1_i1.p1 TRINITY_DN26453_c0_g1~~TRINITY_DN26453_c0_g1_i1.p1  ORF type:complete len:210 (+),score=51.41 TRINITY_DN26453_c0_g1_i1:102-731(+)
MLSSFKKLFEKPGGSKRTLSQVLPLTPEDSEDSDDQSSGRRKSVPQKPEWMSEVTFQLLLIGKEHPPGAAHFSSEPSAGLEGSKLSTSWTGTSFPAGGNVHYQLSNNSCNRAHADRRRNECQDLSKYAKEIQDMLRKNNITPPWEREGDRKKVKRGEAKDDEKEEEEEGEAYKRKLDLLEFRLSEWQLYREMDIERKNRLRHYLGLELL